ncbi:hypothetical protein KKG31_07765 [Patescibacteria group bacterium]|nr:hypothetical protein [Patescibacteria group bacterium]MBU1758962.1 hypothetical protein [Patescibacteria group bacterium]
MDGINNYDLESDPMSQKRRSVLTDIMNNPDGVVASEITKIYTNYRTLHSKYMFKKTHLNIQKFDIEDVEKLSDFVTLYDDETEVSLADKYNNICFVARNLYEKKP